MAINPMSAPIDYLGQMGLSPQDPAQALIGGLKIGTALREQRQMRELEQKNAQFQADMSAWRMNPTDECRHFSRSEVKPRRSALICSTEESKRPKRRVRMQPA
jgi:hypothetical protein